MPLSSSIKDYSYYYCAVGTQLIFKLVGVYSIFPAIIFNIKS